MKPNIKKLLIEAVRERQYGIMPVYTPLFEKEGA